MPAAIPGPAPAANENPSCETPPDDDAATCCCSPPLPFSEGGRGEEGLAVMVMLPSPLPCWAANQILPLSSEVIHCINDPVIGILASLLAPVLGSITAILSIWCSATHRSSYSSIAMPKGRPASLS